MRMTLSAAGALAALAVTTALSAAPAQASPLVQVDAVTGQVVTGEYIVTLRPDASGNVAHRAGVTATHTYQHAITGFAAKLTDRQLHALQRDRDVLAIEPNQVVHAAGTTSIEPMAPTAQWNLDRIDQRNLPLNGQYNYTATGLGITAYIIDTGIQPGLAQFGGRAAVAYDALGGNGIDCNGHGNMVAGFVGSTTYGVAKQVRLRGVRVLNCSGSGTISQVVAGIDWVRANSPGPSVANISLGGGKSTVMDTAVNNLANSGVFVAVASGSSASDACNFSPAGAAQAFTVAASDRNDRVASFSNFGPCIKMYAPGVSITSIGLNGTVQTVSGGSFATAHVTGVAAMYKQRFGEQPTATVHNWLITVSTKNVLIGVPPNTANRLLYTNLI
jgi:hypothetical protein